MKDDFVSIDIYTNKITPTENYYNNKFLKYHKENKCKNLLCSIKKDNKIIGLGIITDFYRNLSMEHGYISSDGNSPIGEDIYKLKYYNLYENERIEKLNRLLEYVNLSFEELRNQCNKNKIELNKLNIASIPSEKCIPSNIENYLSDKYNLDICNFITSNNINIKNKNTHSFEDSYNNSIEKYNLNLSILQSNKNKQFLIVDDIFGFGGSIIHILNTINKYNNKINYFLMCAKDIKR